MLPKTLVLAIPLLLLLSLAGGAKAQAAGSEEVWDSDRSLSAVHIVANGTTLVIRGATISLDAGIIVAPTGRLVLESGPDGAPAVLKAGRSDGWAGAVLGEMIVRSAPGSPAVLDGMTGRAVAANDVVLYEGGIKVIGNVTADGLVVRNYTAAFGMAHKATLTLRNVAFESPSGISVVGTLGHTDIDGGRFVGHGTSIWNVASGNVRVANSTFEGQVVAIAALGNETVVENVTVNGPVATCVRAAKGNLVVRGLRCESFTKNGIEVSRPLQGVGRPSAQLSGLHLSTNLTNGSIGAVYVADSSGVTISHSVLGPVPGNGIQSRGVQPKLDNVTFRGVGEYNVYILDPDGEVRRDGWGEGEVGARGRLYAGATFFAKAANPDGNPAAGAKLEVRLEPSDIVLSRSTLPASGESSKVVLDILYITAKDEVVNLTYHLVAEDHDGKYQWERRGYVPDGSGVLFRLVDPKPEQQAKATTPFPGALALLASLAAVAAVASLRSRKDRP